MFRLTRRMNLAAGTRQCIRPPPCAALRTDATRRPPAGPGRSAGDALDADLCTTMRAMYGVVQPACAWCRSARAFRLQCDYAGYLTFVSLSPDIAVTGETVYCVFDEVTVRFAI